MSVRTGNGSAGGRIVGASRAWRDTLRLAARVAPSETTVLITGESGSGKEVVARRIHRGSPRARGPFVAINCAALPEQLLESELFGHEKGAFTGAVAARAGRLEQAAGGTLLLDEVAELGPAVQAKLLRVLQEREFQRLGGNRPLRADVRVVAATHRDLDDAMARGGFRHDLYFRLAVFEIRVPSLRERREDILPLAECCLEEIGHGTGRPAVRFSARAREWLLGQPWPGNVRELRNAVERAVLLCDGAEIEPAHLRPAAPRGAMRAPAGAPEPPVDLPAGGLDLDALLRGVVEKALHQAGGNRSRAARLLGLSRAQLYSRIDRYDLRVPVDPGRT